MKAVYWLLLVIVMLNLLFAILAGGKMAMTLLLVGETPDMSLVGAAIGALVLGLSLSILLVEIELS